MPTSDPTERTPRGFFVLFQYLLPHHLLSRVVWHATRVRAKSWKNLLIGWFLRHYAVDMSEAAQTDATRYESFNGFFTRALRPTARPIDTDSTNIASPVDGTVSEAGDIDDQRLLQAKGIDYTLAALLGDEELAGRFRHGCFATIYLAPHNYHRIHMPLAGRLLATHYIPGRLFSVNTATTQQMPNLFARNERVVCLFETAAGHMAVILVGALFVGSMSTVWSGDITPAPCRKAARLELTSVPLTLPKGAELGRFNMGSTVVLLFERNKVRLHERLGAGAQVRMGAAIGQLIANDA